MKKIALLFLAISSVFAGCNDDNLTADEMYPEAYGNWILVKRNKFVVMTQTYSNETIENPATLKIQDDGNVILSNVSMSITKEGVITPYEDAWGLTKLEVDFYPDLDPTTVSSSDTFLQYRLFSDASDVVLQNDTLVVSHFISGALVCDHTFYTDKFVRMLN